MKKCKNCGTQFSKNLSDWVCDVCFPKVTRDKKIKAKPIPKLGDNELPMPNFWWISAKDFPFPDKDQ